MAWISQQIQGEATGPAPVRYYIAPSTAPAFGNVVRNHSTAVLVEPAAAAPRYKGMLGTVMTIARTEGPKYVKMFSLIELVYDMPD